ncbi:MAG: TonB-dependent receptor [Deltaproteobacteria bacterium]|nr:TonB-dependent receptor [Deltaproteobacteria bacterium]
MGISRVFSYRISRGSTHIFSVALIVCLVSWILGVPERILAQESPDRQSVLESVVVTASYFEEQVKSLSVPVTVITNEEIVQTNASTLPELLKNYGFQTTSGGTGTGSGRILIRGFAASTNPNESGNVLYLLDGRRIGNNDAGFVAVENLERVEIIRGPASVQYGSEATGGVINMISRRGGEKTRLALEHRIGSFDYNRSAASVSGRLLKNRLDFSFGSSHMNRGSVDVGGGLGKYHHTDIHNRILGGTNLGYNFNENHRLGFVTNFSYGDYSRTGAFRQGSSATPLGLSKRSNYSLDFRYEGAIPESGLAWQARYFFGQTVYETATNWQTRAGYYEYVGKFHGINVDGSWNNGFLYLTGGFDLYKMDYTKTTTPPPSAHTYDYAGFLLARMSFLDDRLWLNGGIRYDKMEIYAAGSVRAGQTLPAQLNRQRYTPSFGVSFLVTDWLKLRANYATSFKMPEPISQMTYSPGDPIYLEARDLQPESSKGWELGTDIYYGGFTVGATYFSVDYKDKIESQVISATPILIRQYQNLKGITEYRGLEFWVDWRMDETFGWNFELKPYISLTRMFRYFNTEKRAKTGYTADLNMSYGLVFNDDNLGLMARVDVTYLGRQLPHYTTAQIEYGRDTLVDFHLSKRLIDWEDKGQLYLKVDMTNIGNRFYRTGTYPEEGRAFYMGLRYEY